MQVVEFGLSNRQMISETCFSGYVELGINDSILVIVVTIDDQFEGDAKLEIVLIADDDDGFYSASEIYRHGPFTALDLTNHFQVKFKEINSDNGRYLCLWYIVGGGSFSSGKMSARMSAKADAWFVRD